MKSGNKLFYNHRVAQSQEKWETDFLSKIKTGNDLLYLAANKNFGWKKVNDSLYTAESRDSLVNQIDTIINNPYNQRNHPDFAGLREAAIAKLDEKIAQNKPKPSPQPTPEPTPGPEPKPQPVSPQDRPGRSTAIDKVLTGNGPDLGREDLYDVNEFGVDAKIFIQDTINPLKNLAEKDTESFKRIGDQEIKKAIDIFNQIKGKLNEKESHTLTIMLSNLRSKYMSAFGPEGVYKAGRSYGKVDYRTAAGEAISLLSDRVYLKDANQIQQRRDQIEKILNVYQTQFINKTPGNTDIEQFIKPINEALGRWNYRYTNLNPANKTNIEMVDKLRPASRI